jgi:cellobiose phosphorylase
VERDGTTIYVAHRGGHATFTEHIARGSGVTYCHRDTMQDYVRMTRPSPDEARIRVCATCARNFDHAVEAVQRSVRG